jgi:hypothetical protein
MVDNKGETKMSFASQTGSMVNHLYARGVKGQPTPVVDMPATLLFYSDRHAATISKVETIRGKLYITVQEDNAVRIDKNGMSEIQEYEYSRNPNGREMMFRQAANGMWEGVRKNAETGRFKKTDVGGLRIGTRESYHDFSF